MSEERYEIWVVLLWMIWSFICNTLHGEGGRFRRPSVEAAQEYHESFILARRAFRPQQALGINVGEWKWFPPLDGVWRLDVDVAVDWETNNFGVGAVVRDSSGKVCAALAKPISRPNSVFEGELDAAVFGMALCIKAGVDPIVLYLDSILAVKALSDHDPTTSLLDEELRVMMERAANGFVVGVFHMYRSSNMIAHNLACFAKSCNSEQCWLIDFPLWVRNLATIDHE